MRMSGWLASVTGRLFRARSALDMASEQMTVRVSGAISHCEAVLWGVDFGPGCRFYGLPIIRRAPDSVIEVGPRCRLRSLQSSNLVGVNRRCVIATLRPEARIVLGSDVGLSGTSVTAAASVTLGDRVLCAANVTITDTDWHSTEPGGPHCRRPAGAVEAVRIEDDVWLGLGVVVLKGVTIGRGSVVSAGSVVTRSVPEHVLAGGCPAKPIRELRLGRR